MASINEKTKDLLKMLGSTIVVAGSAVWFLSSEINSIKTDLIKDMHATEERLSDKISAIDKRVTVIETVLVMQGYPVKHIALNETNDR